MEAENKYLDAEKTRREAYRLHKIWIEVRPSYNYPEVRTLEIEMQARALWKLRPR